MENSDHEDSANLVGKSPGNPVILSEEARAKSVVSRTATVRIESFQRAKRFLPLVEQAREEIERQYHQNFYEKDVSHAAIANWLNDFRDKNGKAFGPPHGQLWSGKQVTKNLMEAPDRIIDAAVLECRTCMTAIALSADFTKPAEAVTELEQEYLGYIADAIEIEHRLNGHRPRTRAELMEEARYKAIEVAGRQRKNKPVSMMARERLWKHFPPVVRKVFEK